MKLLIHMLFCLGLASELAAQVKQNDESRGTSRIIPAAERMDIYLPLLAGKSVAVFANQTSMVGASHLVDTLLKMGIRIVKIFSPEHGFRGNADAGEQVNSQADPKTGIPIISLYGSKSKPSAGDLKDVDVLLFDIQDVGVRFYTYISSLQEFMEAAFEYHKPLMILDRPNPNGFYVDGPVLDTAYRSFVGMQPIPVVYGMTVAEYAFMIAGERWLSDKANLTHDYYLHAQNSADTPFHFQVIKCRNYDHNSRYILPVKPSPNLPDNESIYLYPSLCYFEGTVVSVGRGTSKPFKQFGHPSFPHNLYHFMPQSTEGAKTPPLLGETCYGYDLEKTEPTNAIQLKWLLKAYSLYPAKSSFFIKKGAFFNRLAGNAKLMQQLIDGKSEAEIRESWQTDLEHFKTIRKKYLLYADFAPSLN